MELLVLLGVLAVAVAMAVPAFSRASRHEKVQLCAGNLKGLHSAWSSLPKPVAERGRGFWAAVAKAAPTLVTPRTLQCPFTEHVNPPPVQYLGPSTDPATMGGDGLLGCDEYLNHHPRGREGGNILRKSGRVVTDAGDLWRKATLEGGCSAVGR